MKNIIITTSFPLYEGDYKGNFVLNHAKTLKKTVWIVAPHASNLPVKEKIDGITIFRLPYHYNEDLFYKEGIPEILGQKSFKILKAVPFATVLFLFLLLNTKKEDTIISHWIFPTGLIGALITLIKKNKHKVIVHSGGITLLKKFKLKKISNFINNHTNEFQFVNSEHLKWFEKLLKKSINQKIKLSPMPISEPQMDFNKKFNPKKIMYIGRIEPIKGVENMLNDISNIDIDLSIAGDGSLKKELENKFKEIRFTGSVFGSKKQSLFLSNSVQIIPSIEDNGRIEGFPTVILEGLHYKNLLIVSNKVKGIDYLLQNNENICVYNPDKKNDLINILKNIQKYPDKYEKIAENGFLTYKKFLK